MLMGYGGLNLPYDVPANEFLTFKGDKLSKSRGVSIDIPSMLKKFKSGRDSYYVSVNMPENKDADFSWEDFETKTNNELVATLGNFYHRVLSFTFKHYGAVPRYEGDQQRLDEVMEAIIKAKGEVDENISQCQFKKALKAIMDLAQFGNRFFDAVGPWSLIKTDKVACGSVLYLNLMIVKALSVLSYPYLPRSAQAAWELLGYEGSILDDGWSGVDSSLPVGQRLKEPVPLFSKITLEKEDAVFKGFETLNLKVGQIVHGNDHPNADALLLLEVDIGHKIQVVAGIKAYYEKSALVGKKVVVVTNLKPAKLRGYESQGMLLAADSDEKVRLLDPSPDSVPGEPVNSGMSQSEKMITFSRISKN